MPQGTEISFVVWPNGEIDGGSLTLGGRNLAQRYFVNTFLPEQWFGNTPREYVADTLWKGARDKGFKSFTIKIGDDGKPVLDQQ